MLFLLDFVILSHEVHIHMVWFDFTLVSSKKDFINAFPINRFSFQNYFGNLYPVHILGVRITYAPKSNL